MPHPPSRLRATREAAMRSGGGVLLNKRAAMSAIEGNPEIHLLVLSFTGFDPARSSAGQFAVMHNATVLDFFGGWGSRRGRKPGLSCSGFLSTDKGSAQESRITDGRPLR